MNFPDQHKTGQLNATGKSNFHFHCHFQMPTERKTRHQQKTDKRKIKQSKQNHKRREKTRYLKVQTNQAKHKRGNLQLSTAHLRIKLKEQR